MIASCWHAPAGGGNRFGALANDNTYQRGGGSSGSTGGFGGRSSSRGFGGSSSGAGGVKEEADVRETADVDLCVERPLWLLSGYALHRHQASNLTGSAHEQRA